MSKTLTDIKELSVITEQLISSTAFSEEINKIVSTILEAYKKGNQCIFCGNGGSAAEAQHLAAELSGKFKLDRIPIPAEACHVNPSFITAVSNDYDFTKVYSRYINAFGKEGDVLIGLSTSGTSENIVNAFKTAKEKKLITVAFTGKSGGLLNELSNFILKVPSINVPRVQEIHLLIGHIICEQVEHSLFDTK